MQYDRSNLIQTRASQLIPACPVSPMGTTTRATKPNSSLITGIAFIRPSMPAVTKYHRPSSR